MTSVDLQPIPSFIKLASVAMQHSRDSHSVVDHPIEWVSLHFQVTLNMTSCASRILAEELLSVVCSLPLPSKRMNP